MARNGIKSKRKQELQGLAEQAGLEIQSLAQSSGGHVVMVVRNRAGVVRKFFAPQTGSDVRGDHNLLSFLRRFGRATAD